MSESTCNIILITSWEQSKFFSLCNLCFKKTPRCVFRNKTLYVVGNSNGTDTHGDTAASSHYSGTEGEGQTLSLEAVSRGVVGYDGVVSDSHKLEWNEPLLILYFFTLIKKSIMDELFSPCSDTVCIYSQGWRLESALTLRCWRWCTVMQRAYVRKKEKMLASYLKKIYTKTYTDKLVTLTT